MQVINKQEFEQSQPSILKELEQSIFIYPTDSIYGLGCDATNKKLVQKVREIKNSTLQPFSVIAPSKQWVYDNCEVKEKAKEWVEKLGTLLNINGEPQTFSLILPLKNKKAVAQNVLQGRTTIGVRIPAHWFSKAVDKMNVPIITTSANPTGGDFMTSLEDLHEKVRTNADFCIYDGEKKGKPSALIHFEQESFNMLKR